MLLAPLYLVHRLTSLQRQLAAAKKRTSWLEPAATSGEDAVAAAAALLQSPPLMDPSCFEPSHPARFYLPGNSAAMEQLSDCFALVGGVRLPLHTTVLATQAAVLRDMFVALGRSGKDGGTEGSKSGVELSSAFAGCPLLAAAVFLRFIYSPDHATPASLHAVHCYREGLLAAVAGLAHRLDAGGLLAKVEAYFQAASASASISELLCTIQLSETCHLGSLADTCLTLLAHKLAAAGPFWHEQVRREQLAGCSSESLAALACKMAGTVNAGAFEPPAVHAVLPGRRGEAGGFTWVITRFSKQQGRVTSPWVEVGDLQWRLKVWPRGDDAAGGTHLSAYLECNLPQAQAHGVASIEAYYDFTFLDQSEEGLHYNVDCGKDVFTPTTQNWGKTRMMPLDELARQDRQYLDKDRLAVRIAMRVLPPAGTAQAPSSAAPAVPVVPLAPAVPPMPALLPLGLGM